MPRVSQETEDQFEHRVLTRFKTDPELKKMQDALNAATTALCSRKRNIMNEEKALLGIPSDELTSFECCEYEAMHGVH
jgi:hypothetical protein